MLLGRILCSWEVDRVAVNHDGSLTNIYLPFPPKSHQNDNKEIKIGDNPQWQR